ncbi:MAG: hypothetical protein CAPSK01_000612 [Candidatus Accumulibacter vicinus]|uniref:Uncharacterized protein n=1 Tax=Candidatus Accumulibacter vicinus TaxID=2954382 RepID=A0A084Y4M3_9PROT|nr:MAG: hypothetical protein CAPSK01_000612 [Candidatus Accumulibacter vicinus]
MITSLYRTRHAGGRTWGNIFTASQAKSPTDLAAAQEAMQRVKRELFASFVNLMWIRAAAARRRLISGVEGEIGFGICFYSSVAVTTQQDPGTACANVDAWMNFPSLAD